MMVFVEATHHPSIEIHQQSTIIIQPTAQWFSSAQPMILSLTTSHVHKLTSHPSKEKQLIKSQTSTVAFRLIKHTINNPHQTTKQYIQNKNGITKLHQTNPTTPTNPSIIQTLQNTQYTLFAIALLSSPSTKHAFYSQNGIVVRSIDITICFIGSMRGWIGNVAWMGWRDCRGGRGWNVSFIYVFCVSGSNNIVFVCK